MNDCFCSRHTKNVILAREWSTTSKFTVEWFSLPKTLKHDTCFQERKEIIKLNKQVKWEPQALKNCTPNSWLNPTNTIKWDSCTYTTHGSQYKQLGWNMSTHTHTHMVRMKLHQIYFFTNEHAMLIECYLLSNP